MLNSLAIDFRRADIRTRERFHLSAERLERFYDERRTASLRELALLSTCNRIELYGWTVDSDGDESPGGLTELARHWMGGDDRTNELIGTATHRSGFAAARHLIRVTSGLESQVLGDAQILGQVRTAYRRAATAEAVGPSLHRLFGAALHAAKRVQRETGLVAGRQSVATEAASLAARKAGPLLQRRCVVIGCGKTGAIAARHLAKLGASDLVTINRSEARAVEVARQVWGRAASFGTLHREIAVADVVIVATSAELPPVRMASLRFCREMAAANDRPLLIVDLSVPRSVEPEVAGLPNVTLVDLDSLHVPLATAAASRRAAVPAAEQIVEEELARYAEWLLTLPVRDAIRPLRETLEALARREVAYAAGESVADRTAARITAKLLAGPMEVLRSASARGESVDGLAEALRVLFCNTQTIPLCRAVSVPLEREHTA